ncbi:hypothetical protein [Streptomyces sp. NPDC093223]|uniref:hypothetical protein n=1 Tax=Streptomyces sp. NPDC093223 TaxID=3366033 RepID=UPI00381826D7
MSDLWSLLRDTHDLQVRIDALRISDAAGTTSTDQERDYLIRRAALAHRHLAVVSETGSDHDEAQRDAEKMANLLWKHDRLHSSHRGPRPADDPIWQTRNLRDYVRQEAVAMRLTGF